VSSLGHSSIDRASRDDWLFDASLAILGVTLILAPYLVAIAYFGPDVSKGQMVTAALVGLALCLATVLRRHLPIIYTLLVAVLTLVHILVVPLPFSMLIAAPASVHAVARYIRGQTWWVLVLWIVGGLAAVLRWYTAYESSDPLRTVSILGAVSFVGIIAASYSIGRRGHDLAEARAAQVDAFLNEDSVTAQLAERPEILELVEQRLTDEQLADLARQSDEQHDADVEIRAALANEVHDGVAHALSLVIVQAEEAKSQLRAHPDEATEAIDAVVETSQNALTELRRIVRVLRAEEVEEAIAHLPTPVWEDVPGLVSEAGAELTVTGEPPEYLDDVLSLTAYRIIQEALTNVLQHAGPEAVGQVFVDWGDEDVEISVTNGPTDFVSPATADGQGLDTMAERVEAVAGLLETGPTEDGGFRVWASLPYEVEDVDDDDSGYYADDEDYDDPEDEYDPDTAAGYDPEGEYDPEGDYDSEGEYGLEDGYVPAAGTDPDRGVEAEYDPEEGVSYAPDGSAAYDPAEEPHD
jgi:signal transduction histidine kinase